MRRSEAARSDRSLQRMQLHCAVGWVDVPSSVLYVALQVLDELEAGIAAGNSQPLPPDRLV
jgi:hypothetical protein